MFKQKLTSDPQDNSAERTPMKLTRYGKRTVTIAEAAQILGIGRNQAYEAAHAGTLPTIAFGERKGDGRPTRYVVPIAALERLLSNRGELERTALSRAAKGEIP